MKSNNIGAFMIGAAVGAIGMAHGADVTDVTPAPNPALHKTIETCGTCHGVNGRSVSPLFPIWQPRRHLISKRSYTRLRIKQEPIRMRKPTCGAWHRR